MSARKARRVVVWGIVTEQGSVYSEATRQIARAEAARIRRIDGIAAHVVRCVGTLPARKERP